MNKAEFFEMDAADAAAKLQELVDAGKTEAEACAEFGITKADLMKANIFFVKGKFMARAWGGYTSTKRTGNEMGDSEQGAGRSDASKGFAGI